ncbi:alpha/beta fold hydrolase [Agarivorans aestuarii]|uniref:alpha/beta fold hydrolase n=1 Tax=Agarivorans aestuarii TaxID=1563703 RepID=UPI001C82644D|nr:alpha/beta hydrolase [Agarivorans aestuarii]
MTQPNQANSLNCDTPQPSNKQKRHQRVVPLRYQAAGLAFNLAGLVSQAWAANTLAKLWFRVFKRKVSPNTQAFWQSAEQTITLKVNQHKLPLHLWGKGPLVVCLHGWSGSGVQFRHFVQPLVDAGYQVATFDAPGHGSHQDSHSHLLEFSDSLMAIQQQVAKVHCVLAHSFGAMATTTAQLRGFAPTKLVMLAPHLDVEEMFSTYANLLNLRQKLKATFKEQVGQKMQKLLAGDDPWQLFSVERLTPQATPGLLISDSQDQEVSQQQFKQIQQCWPNAKHQQTEGLGHFRLLKDPQVIAETVSFVGNQSH